MPDRSRAAVLVPLLALALAACGEEAAMAPEPSAPADLQAQVGIQAMAQSIPVYGGSLGGATAPARDAYVEYWDAGTGRWEPAHQYGGHPWGFVAGTDSWLNCRPSDVAPECLNTTVQYRIRFHLPDGATSPALEFLVNADNYATTSLNGTVVSAEFGGGHGVNYPVSVTDPARFVTGVNELVFDVRDTGGLAGLNFAGTISATAAGALALLPAGGLELVGFLRPIRGDGWLNVVQGGSTVPLRFEVWDGGAPVSDPAIVTGLHSLQVNCDNLAPMGSSSAAPFSAVRYDAADERFMVQWRAPRQAGRCYQVTVEVADAQELSALFRTR
jgi:hypothetical protein